jgi:hypothetical protein
MKFTKNIGFLLLAIWLILTGLSAFISMGGLAVGDSRHCGRGIHSTRSVG